MMKQDDANAFPTVFEASIGPYRSLGRKGIIALPTLLTVFASFIGLRFWFLGAWPVVLFSLLEIPFVVLLLWLNMRARRTNEVILVTARDITVTRTEWTGRRTTVRMPTAWLRIDQETVHGATRLLLRTHGAEWEVGGFLHEAERESLFTALRGAMHTIRNPSFDNPQLRDEATC
ncbi:MAG TPA: DUF2244 domain-containing protein [Rhodopila sp.]|jgi:uncharacterized membrane protein|nr:DUF2244 domain-containing protein [Rhodopila sp.]